MERGLVEVDHWTRVSGVVMQWCHFNLAAGAWCLTALIIIRWHSGTRRYSHRCNECTYWLHIGPAVELCGPEIHSFPITSMDPADEGLCGRQTFIECVFWRRDRAPRFRFS